MSSPSRWPLRAWLLVTLVGACGVSAINATNYADFRLEMLPLPPLIVFLFWLERRHSPLSSTAYMLLFVFLLLHLLGAHYLYSNVPYDEWWRSIFGVTLSERLGTDRNHYDRLVHLSFGLLVTLPMIEAVERLIGLRRGWAIVVAVAFLAVLSKVYELAEWALALLMDPEDAEAYNGQQGDMFDAHKDMALALAGSVVSGSLIAAFRPPAASGAEHPDTRRSRGARSPAPEPRARRRDT